MKVVAVVQARMGSTRLHGKVMLPLAGRPVIGHVVDRIRRVPEVDEVVVATSTLQGEQPLIDYLATLPGISIFRGSAQDVLHRYYQAALAAQATVVVRITADCPLLSTRVSSEVIKDALSRPPGWDFVSNTLIRTYPDGLDTEVMTFAAIEVAHRQAALQPEREHVTPYILTHPDRFNLYNVADSTDRHHLRWTLDTPEDYKLISGIYDSLYPSNPLFDYGETLALLDQKPESSVPGTQTKLYAGEGAADGRMVEL
jgi:spore coat polysaccharide biosynthesis protein SpsF